MMPYNDYFRLTYIILSEILSAMEEGKDVEVDRISAEALEIPKAYWNRIIKNCYDKGFVGGIKIGAGAHPAEDIRISNLKNAYLTIDGVQFLQDNAKMNEVKDYLSSVK